MSAVPSDEAFELLALDLERLLARLELEQVPACDRPLSPHYRAGTYHEREGGSR